MPDSYYYFTGADGETKGPFTPGEIFRLSQEEILSPSSVLRDLHGQIMMVDEVVQIENLKSNPLSPSAPQPPPLPSNGTKSIGDAIPLCSRRVAIAWILLIGARQLWKVFQQPEQPKKPSYNPIPLSAVRFGKLPKLSQSGQPEQAAPSSESNKVTEDD